MLSMMVQLVIISIWGAMLVVHTRRLLRLAHAPSIQPLGNHPLRFRLSRVWWWLGREEFWRNVQADGLRCMELTLMLFVIAWVLGG